MKRALVGWKQRVGKDLVEILKENRMVVGSSFVKKI